MTGRGLSAAHHAGRLAEELRLSHPERASPTASIRDAADPAVAREHARHRGVSTHHMWDERNRLFAAVNRKLLAIVTSHLDGVEKASRIMETFRSEVRPNNVHLRAKTYEDIFECLLSHTGARDGDPAARRHVYADALFDMYHAMKAGFTAPTPKILEYLMFSAAYELRTNPQRPVALLESRAHKLWLDADRFAVAATKYTYTHYFEVCAAANVMHIALARYVDAREKLGVQPDAAMCTTVIRGFVRNGQTEEAVAFVGAMYAVPVDASLLDAVLECLGASTDPLAAFSVYRAMVGRVRPGRLTFHYLMRACAKAGDFRETPFVLREMVRRGVQGTHATLNLALKGLLLLRRDEMAETLYVRMKRREHAVWPELEGRVSEAARERGVQRGLIAKVGRETRERLTSKYEESYAKLALGCGGPEGTSKAPAKENTVKPVFAVEPNGTGEGFPLVPRDEAHLRDFVVLRRLKWVCPEYLAGFALRHALPIFSDRNIDTSRPRKLPNAAQLAAVCLRSPQMRRKVFGAVKRHFFRVEKRVKPKETIEVTLPGERDEKRKPRRLRVLGVDVPQRVGGGEGEGE